MMSSLSTSNAPFIALMPMATQKGGAEVMLQHLVAHRPTREWIVVFLEDGPMVEEFREMGVDTHVIEAGRLRQVGQFARTVRDIANYARSRGAVGIVSWLAKAQLYGGLAALWAKIPAFWYQLALPADVHWMDRLATLIPARAVLTCSAAGAAQQGAIYPYRETRVVHPGVDLSRFDADALPAQGTLRETLGLPTDAPIVGTVGRLQHWKGMHTFIDAIARLRPTYPNIRGVIVGGKHDLEPEYPSQLRHQIERHGLDDAILMTGFQSNPNAWMKSFDVFVHASDREPFGLVVIEAMAMGLPVVASDTAGPTEVITEGENGLFAAFEDDAALSHAIDRYLSDERWAADVGRAARQRAQDFAAPAYARALTTTVRDAVHVDSVPTSV